MLRSEAARWLARVQSGREADIEPKFHRWLDADPRHAEAFDRVRRSYELAGLLRHSSAALRRPEPTQRDWAIRPAFAVAAAIIALVPLGLLGLHRGGFWSGDTDAVMLMTRVGEIRQVSLADGSKVTLDTSTKLDVRVGRTQRRVILRYGRARFQVAQASAPFVVQTERTAITARDAIFDVEEGPEKDRIEVLAGAADMRGSAQGLAEPLAVRAGEAAVVSSRGAEERKLAAPDRNWTRGMLQFDSTPLADAVALANRYSERHIILDSDLPALQVSGVFHAGDTAGLARALATAFGLSLERSGSGDLRLSRRPQTSK